MPDILVAPGAAETTRWVILVAVPLLCYGLGCVSAGYYLVRHRAGSDIRDEGSGSSGATNVGRKLGPAAFAAILILDIAKGALAVALARQAGLSGRGLALAMTAVIVGHIWPAQLGFRGGKGAATLMGTLIAADIHTAIIITALLLPLLLVFRRFTPSGLAALALSPVALAIAGRPAGQVLTMSLLALLVLAAHIPNLREEYARFRQRCARNTAGSEPFEGR